MLLLVVSEVESMVRGAESTVCEVESVSDDAVSVVVGVDDAVVSVA